jgi:hypothetical protein
MSGTPPLRGRVDAAAAAKGTIPVGRRWSHILVSVAAFVLTLFLFTPARIFIGNFMEFTSLFPESMLVFLAASLAMIVVLFAVLLALSWRAKACRTIVAALSASAFLMWFQATVFLWPYGVLNGRDIPWNDMMRYGFIDGAFWAAVLAFALMRDDLVFRVSRLLGTVLVVVQLLSVGWSWIGMPKDQSFKQQQTETDTLYRFSKHVNVIVMVLDTLQSDFFQDIIRGDAELAASFEGFTYFRNALTSSDGTIGSVPNMLTGTCYDNSQPYLEYVKGAFLGNSLPKTLTEYGFAVDLHPMIWYSVYSDFSGIAPTGRRLRNWDAFWKEQAFIADLALFRCVPHFAKEYVYHGQRWFLTGIVERRLDARHPYVPPNGGGGTSPASPAPKYAREFDNLTVLLNKNRDPQFIDAMLRTSATMERTDAFKFYHLKGIHLPLFMDENCAYDENMEAVREDMLRQGTGILKIAAMFLEKLKQLGVYDQSLIFIVGDHGSGVGKAKINVTPYANRFNTRSPYKGNFPSFKAAGIPMILAKRMNATGELKVSDAPVWLGDIPQTVVEELGLEASFPGRSMFTVGEDEHRQRIYRAFVGSQVDPVYLAPLYEYAVDGFSWDDTSWRETGNIYYAPK